MKYFTINIKVLAAFSMIAMLVSGCDKSEQATFSPELKAITADDECHVCGMEIINYPGPKAQAFIRHQDTPLKFCSTVDLFGWLLQPDTPAILHSAYVHDMGAATTWRKPSDEHFLDVRQAWFVIGHNKPGAMGPTLASFQEKQAAEKFIKQQGGRILRFNDIDLELLAELRMKHTVENNQKKP
jgi:copper chaperone NosL